jgi:hypothetical protein
MIVEERVELKFDDRSRTTSKVAIYSCHDLRGSPQRPFERSLDGRAEIRIGFEDRL